MKLDRRRRASALAVLLLAVASFGNAFALTDEEIFREFRFNFVSPGAHALGLGGAYISAATDATAAEANPAALQYVSKKQIFVEFRESQPASTFLQPSSGEPFGDNAVGSTETFANFLIVNNQEDRSFPSFASFVLPFRMGQHRATVALSRQVVLDTQSSLTLGENGTFFDVSLPSFPNVVVPGDFPNPPTTERYVVSNTVEGALDAELVHYNLGFSISLHQDFSLGLTATLAELSMDSLVDSTVVDPFPVLDSIHPRIGNPGEMSDIKFRSTIDDESDTDLAYTVGLHWHPDSVFPDGVSPVRFGLVYRKGAELAVDQVFEELKLNPDTGTFESVSQGVLNAFDNVLKVPDRWGVGASYHGPRHWLLSADLERIQYSDLLDDFEKGINFFTNPELFQFPETNLPNLDELVFDVDDATVVRVGAEYSFISRGTWQHALRLGYFNAPDNKIALSRIEDEDVDDLVEDIFLDLFRPGEDIDHFTVGFTLGVPGGVQFQFAGDFSDDVDEFVASVIYQFGKTVLGR